MIPPDHRLVEMSGRRRRVVLGIALIWIGSREGSAVAFADGTGEWLDAAKVAQLIKQSKSRVPDPDQ